MRAPDWERTCSPPPGPGVSRHYSPTSATQLSRPPGVFTSDQHLIRTHRADDHGLGGCLRQRAIESLRGAVLDGLEEDKARAKPLVERAADILAYFDRSGISNGPTKAVDGRLERLRGIALGFRNLTHYTIRCLIHAECFKGHIKQPLNPSDKPHLPHPQIRRAGLPVGPAWCTAVRGSSPLARGLRDEVIVNPPEGRIIPARAGFTRRGGGGRRRPADHPRSRGVYVFGRSWRPALIGSSPLARGLRFRKELASRPDRIIPARAGFTGAAAPPRHPSPDHPRSRGVYQGPPPDTSGVGGSSPLARGLPGADLLDADPAWIIPARAGFTRSSWICGSRQPDHPRSRGVYLTGWTDEMAQIGSSPLARGLHAQPWSAPCERRIIPARAGFTSRVVLRFLWSWDHPRSRGVYLELFVLEEDFTGSSPLARGLRVEVAHGWFLSGIIPARAGFTLPNALYNFEHRDHPRSRGVYVIPAHAGSTRRGSSPLARGLPRLRRHP